MLNKLSFERYIGVALLVFAALGIFASFILSVERVNILKDANHELSCSINAAFNCASVMNSWQAEIFGFPNTFVGLIGYSFVAILGWILITEGRINKLTLTISYIASIGAFIFSYWLLFESVYVIKSLCIYCLMSCFAATNILIAFEIYALKENIFNFSQSTHDRLMSYINKGYHWPLIAVWYFIIFIIVYLEFQSRF